MASLEVTAVQDTRDCLDGGGAGAAGLLAAPQFAHGAQA
jgi:hypothetical protein